MKRLREYLERRRERVFKLKIKRARNTVTSLRCELFMVYHKAADLFEERDDKVTSIRLKQLGRQCLTTDEF